MNKKLIKKTIKKELIYSIVIKKYFDENISEISDFDFDKLKKKF